MNENKPPLNPSQRPVTAGKDLTSFFLLPINLQADFGCHSADLKPLKTLKLNVKSVEHK